MMHEITVCIVEVAMLRWFGLKTYNGWHGLWEWSTTSTGLGTDGKAGSRKGGTGTPFWSCGEESGMWSHLGGTDMELWGGQNLR